MPIRGFKLIESRKILSLDIRNSTKGTNLQTGALPKKVHRVTFKKQSKQN